MTYSTLKKRYASEDETKTHGGQNKLFFVDEEQALSEYVKNMYIACNVYFDDDSLGLED